MKSYKQYAFTLIETLASLAIIAILLAISFPFAKNFIANTQDEILQKKLLNAIETAKHESVAQHATVALSIDANQNIRIFLDEYADGIIHDDNQIITLLQSQSKHGSIHFRAFQSPENYLQFSPIGLMKYSNSSFWHCHTHSPIWAIIISKTGRVRIAYPNKYKQIKMGNNQSLPC